MSNPYDLARRAANELRARSGVDTYDVAVVLGSGWQAGASALATGAPTVPTSDLAGFFTPTVSGHAGEISSLEIDGRHVAIVSGRVHLYEGHHADEVVHPVRTLIAAGAKRVVLTNALSLIHI